MGYHYERPDVEPDFVIESRQANPGERGTVSEDPDYEDGLTHQWMRGIYPWKIRLDDGFTASISSDQVRRLSPLEQLAEAADGRQ